MFTVEDICNIAVQIEHNGEASYRQAAQEAADPKIKTLLNKMADEERQHAKWFNTLGAKHIKNSLQPEMAAMGRSLLQEMVKGQTFSLESSALAETDEMEALVKQSIVFEQDTITFYEMLTEFVDDEQVKKQLRHIIEEEQQHIVRLRHLGHAQK